MKYIKENPRITVKIFDSNTEELLMTITDRNWMNVGEIFPQHNISALIIDEFKKKKKSLPEKVLVMIGEEYYLDE